MTVTEKLSLWGAAHAAARNAEQQAAQHTGGGAEDLRLQARQLRERADRLHREAYQALGPSRARESAPR